MRLFFSNLLFLMLFSPIANGQNALPKPATIKGSVSDSASLKGVEGSIITLLAASDSSLVKTAFSEPDGSFIFEEIAAGNYFLYVETEGYRSISGNVFTVADSSDVSLPTVTITKKEAQELEEFVVRAKIPLVVRKLDRTVVNVDAMITAAGNSVLELLGKSPGVLVDPSAGVMLKGKAGVLIYIDDKPTYLSGESLLNLLRSMPASSVSQVEIITTPPAKYDAAGNMGIINIVTKKSRVKGFNGSVSTSYGQGRYAKNNNSLNFSYRNNKISVFGTFSGGVYNGFSDLYINRAYKNADGSPKSYFNQNSKFKEKTGYGNARIGTDYYLSEKTTIGATVSGMINQGSVPILNTSELYDSDKNHTGTVIANNLRTDQHLNGSVNLNLRHKFDTTGRELSVDLDCIRYAINGHASFVNDIYSGGVFQSREELKGTLPANIAIYSAKADYTIPLKKDASLSTGGKMSYTDIDNLVEYYNIVNGEDIPDYTKSNHFLYDEMILALYANYTKNVRRFSFQAGLRTEGTLSRGRQLGNPANPASTFKRDYLAVFPTTYVSYNLDSSGNNQLIFSYGRRIDRPYYQDLNPFVEPLDKFTFYTGNPMLRPTFSNNLSFTYGYKSNFSATVNYNIVRNEINETLEITADQLYYSRPGNIGRSMNLNLALDATIPFAKWLSTNMYTEIAHQQYRSTLYTETLNTKGNYIYLYINNSFTIGKGWSAELSGFYISRSLSAQITALQRGQAGIAVQKKVLKDKGTAKISVQDLFYTQRNNGIINNLRLTEASYKNRSDTRVVFLSFSYAFGKPFQSAAKREIGAESEKSRVK